MGLRPHDYYDTSEYAAVRPMSVHALLLTFCGHGLFPCHGLSLKQPLANFACFVMHYNPLLMSTLADLDYSSTTILNPHRRKHERCQKHRFQRMLLGKYTTGSDRVSLEALVLIGYVENALLRSTLAIQ